MFILIATRNFNDKHVIDLMKYICTRLAWENIMSKKYFIERTIFIGSDIRIVFKPALDKKIKGLRPDCFWSNSYECDEYLRNTGSKELKNFEDLVSVIEEHFKHNSNLPERYKTCGRCVHDKEGDIVGSTCYMCKRNSTDHRIDWFEERKEDTNEQ